MPKTVPARYRRAVACPMGREARGTRGESRETRSVPWVASRTFSKIGERLYKQDVTREGRAPRDLLDRAVMVREQGHEAMP